MMLYARMAILALVVWAAPSRADSCFPIVEQMNWPGTVAFVGIAIALEEPLASQCVEDHDALPVVVFAVEEGDSDDMFVRASFAERADSPLAFVAALGRALVVAHPVADRQLKFGSCSTFMFGLEDSAERDVVAAALDERWPRTSPTRYEEPLLVSVDEIIQLPNVFAGRIVRTRGFARFSWEECCIVFATSDARHGFDSARALGLQLIPLSLEREPLLATRRGGAIASLRPFASRAATITATFELGDAANEARVGRLVDVIVFEPTGPTEREALQATFDQGMERKLTNVDAP